MVYCVVTVLLLERLPTVLGRPDVFDVCARPVVTVALRNLDSSLIEIEGCEESP